MSRPRSAASAAALDVTDPESARVGGRRARAVRDPRQQRRHRRVRVLRRHRPRAVGAGAGDQPRRRASPAPTRSLPGMQEAGYGRIVNIASEAGRVGSKGSAVYSAAKGGVIALHQGDRARGRPLRDHRQRDRARPDRDAAADAGARVRRDRREDHRDDEGAGPSCAGWASPRRSRPRSPSSPPTTPPTSPARRSASPAGWGWC